MFFIYVKRHFYKFLGSKEKQKIALEKLYHDEFSQRQKDFLNKELHLKKGSWMKELKTIFSEEEISSFQLTLTDEELCDDVILCLKKKNDIISYKTFINIWKVQDNCIAKIFEEKLKQKIKDQGLSELDDEYQIKCKYGYFIFTKIMNVLIK